MKYESTKKAIPVPGRPFMLFINYSQAKIVSSDDEFRCTRSGCFPTVPDDHFLP